MTSADLNALLDFHYWARDRMLASVASLTAEQYLKPMGSSFSSIRDTLVHLYSGERVWCARWNGASPMSHIDAAEYPELGTLSEAWRSLESDVRAFVSGLTDADVDRVFEFKMMNGQAARSPIGQSVQHLVNHGTYHRGQVATMLRQAGATAMGTDLIVYHRERT